MESKKCGTPMDKAKQFWTYLSRSVNTRQNGLLFGPPTQEVRQFNLTNRVEAASPGGGGWRGTDTT